jgi:hypothetical protein
MAHLLSVLESAVNFGGRLRRRSDFAADATAAAAMTATADRWDHMVHDPICSKILDDGNSRRALKHPFNSFMDIDFDPDPGRSPIYGETVLPPPPPPISAETAALLAQQRSQIFADAKLHFVGAGCASRSG